MKYIIKLIFFYFIILLLFNSASYSDAKTKQSKQSNEKEEVKIETKEEQSPAIYAPNGNVKINYYGISKKQYDELHELLKGQGKTIESLLKNLDERDVKLSERDAKIEEWINKYKELESRIVNRPAEDKLATQAKEKLNNGDLEGAEKILKQSLEKNLKSIEETKKAAAADSYDLGSIKELQLDYKEAKDYFERAALLDSKNTDYLNRFGLILDNLGDSKKAIEYLDKAYKIFSDVYGNDHPYTKAVKLSIEKIKKQ